MGLFGNKFNKIKRSDIVDNIIEVEKEQQNCMDNIESRNKEIETLFGKGKATRDRTMQLALAKRINLLKAENEREARRIQFLNGNLQALNQLKSALDDRDFLVNNSKIPLNKLLGDTKELNKFLASVTNKKMRNEDTLAGVLDTFEGADEGYEENEKIYGMTEADNQLLAMFEDAHGVSDFDAVAPESAKEEERRKEESNL